MIRDDDISEDKSVMEQGEARASQLENAGATGISEADRLTAELQATQDKYLRLYAEFENYKKRTGRDKEEIIQYANERLLSEILPVVDHLEMALKHASNDTNTGIAQGVEITLRELKKIMQKFGIIEIEAAGKAFDPLVHHAMAQIERDDIDENMVVEEYRKGYKLKDKVIRAAMVAVSKKPPRKEKEEDNASKDSS